MSTIFLIILVNFLLIAGLYFLLKNELENKFKEKEIKEKESETTALEKLYSIYQELRGELETKLESIKKDIQEKLEKSVEKTAKIEEVARILESYSFDLKNLKEVLAGTKTKGTFGEKILEEILKELPSSLYEKQFKIGTFIVDFVLKINETIIPIDSKFPYSTYSKILESNMESEKEKLKKELIKALKNHIDSISLKYIVPLKGTVEYAIMFIPAEGLFYEILSNKDYDEVWDYAREKSVIISSPKTFEVLCSQLSMVLRKQEFAKNVNEILKSISQLEKDLNDLGTHLERARNQITNTTSNLEQAYRAFNRFLINFKDLLRKEQKLNSVLEESETKVKTLL